MITYWREIAIAAALALAGLQTVRLAGEEAEHFKTKTAHAVQLQRLAERAKSVADAIAAADESQRRAFNTIDLQRTQEKDRALSDNDARRARDIAGAGGLRIPATCRPASSPGVPAPAAPSGVAAPAAEIPAAFRQELWDLRAALIVEREQLLGLQAYVRELTGMVGGDVPQ